MLPNMSPFGVFLWVSVTRSDFAQLAVEAVFIRFRGFYRVATLTGFEPVLPP